MTYIGLGLSEEDMLTRLANSDENFRYQAMLQLREPDIEVTPAIVERLREMLDDSSRPVRQLARDILQSEARAQGWEDDDPSPERDTATYPGSMLLAIISWGSALTGLGGSGVCLLSYYLLDKFPFPNAIDVLMVTNVVLTVPYLALGLFLLFPGKGIKQLAFYYAIFSLLLCLALIGGLGPVFDRYWAVQFTLEDQARFRNFFSPFQVTLLLMPVIAGQVMQIYFTSQYVKSRAPAGAGNEVDMNEEGG